MSMIGNFRLATADELAALAKTPERIDKFLYDEKVPEDLVCDIDKAWHGLHYLLTGSDWEGGLPLGFIAGSEAGEAIGDVDVGYGPARGFSPSQLAEIVRALEPIDADELRLRFDPEEMRKLEIYPNIWDRDPEEDDTLGYLVEHYGALKQFLAAGAARGFGLIVYLN